MYQLGFTPEEEQELVASSREMVTSSRELSTASRRMVGFIDTQEQIRTLIIAGTVAGFLYTLARFGDLAMQMRRRAKEGS